MIHLILGFPIQLAFQILQVSMPSYGRQLGSFRAAQL